MTPTPTCAACATPGHTIQACPEIRALLFSPFTDVCISCGDQLHWDAPVNTICGACMEWECKQLDLDFAPIGWA